MAKSGCGKLGEKALKIDAFGRPFEFVLPNGTKRYKSLVGSLLTVFLALIVTLYTAYKLQLLLNNDQVFVMVTTEESFQDENKEDSAISSSVNGFNIAVGLFNFEDFTTVDNYEEYGKLTITMRHRSLKFPNFTYSELQLHPCTSEEISLPEEDGKGSNDGDQGTGTFFPFEGPKIFMN